VRVLHDGLMCTPHGDVQKLFRLRQARSRGLAKRMHESFYGDLRCSFTMQMPTHAIRHNQQQRLIGIGMRNPVLIVFSAANTAGLVYGKIHLLVDSGEHNL